ncbi:hypothetical protein [Phytohabitans aurantiacus]|uniref:Uncharacterized protein n=1 Tax=Phytohabitans aurantiacus TaxID=3016789 RepID=A0ABQ5QU21_9ACTN|nr:hypothetical protein [Phytohabitans aurantiacus]GLH97377.1 hypothetical protein Pa4123_26520 [Phytohabitans aurantiacus]
MGDPLKPAKVAMGLEVWAIGTARELEWLQAALAGIGVVVVPTNDAGRPTPTTSTPLGGADKGRSRIYHRVHVRERAS